VMRLGSKCEITINRDLRGGALFRQKKDGRRYGSPTRDQDRVSENNCDGEVRVNQGRRRKVDLTRGMDFVSGRKTRRDVLPEVVSRSSMKGDECRAQGRAAKLRDPVHGRYIHFCTSNRIGRFPMQSCISVKSHDGAESQPSVQRG
jgi:hypothetical protein